MEIYIEKEDRRIKRSFSGKAKDLLRLLKINPQTVLIVKDDELISEDTVLKDLDIIRLLSVISGG